MKPGRRRETGTFIPAMAIMSMLGCSLEGGGVKINAVPDRPDLFHLLRLAQSVRQSHTSSPVFPCRLKYYSDGGQQSRGSASTRPGERFPNHEQDCGHHPVRPKQYQLPSKKRCPSAFLRAPGSTDGLGVGRERQC